MYRSHNKRTQISDQIVGEKPLSSNWKRQEIFMRESMQMKNKVLLNFSNAAENIEFTIPHFAATEKTEETDNGIYDLSSSDRTDPIEEEPHEKIAS
ncbi:unnamed protein product [Onchocerca flexuosa]|uniref:Uncharacterized protein n=1 Tax=Onchocerca flexuosa TaxID=387005 RepID=A0A183H419_9BILA|nr:unnamed protein product [Onchocerca flexuosa]